MIPKICLFALICVLLNVILDGLGFKSKGIFALLCAVLMLISFFDSLSGSFSGIIALTERAGINDAAACALRAIGLGYIFGFTSEICQSLGEGLVASVLTAVGRLQIFLVAYPYFEKIVNLGAELL